MHFGLFSAGQELFGGDGDGARGEFVAVVQEADLGHDVVLEREGCIGDVSVRAQKQIESESSVKEVHVGGGDSLEGATDFAEAILVLCSVQGNMGVLFAAEDAVPDDDLVPRVSLRVVRGCEADKDLLGVPVEQRRKVGVDIEIDFDKVLDVAVHVPGGFGAHHLELVDDDLAGGLVRAEAGKVDEHDEDEDDGRRQRRDGVETRERAVHRNDTSKEADGVGGMCEG